MNLNNLGLLGIYNEINEINESKQVPNIMELNLIYSKPTINNYIFENDNSDRENVIKGNFPIKYDKDLGMYMIDIFIGNINNQQCVSLILDMRQIDILIPTPCCINKGCLLNSNYGLYYFQKSDTCEIPLENKSSSKCNEMDCYTISLLQNPIDMRLITDFGIINKVDAMDYISFKENTHLYTINDEITKTNDRITNNRIKRTPLKLILGEDGEFDTYIPPTLGLGVGNVLSQNFIYFDLINNFITFEKPNININGAHILAKGNEYYSCIVADILINNVKQKINTTNITMELDIGINTINLPKQIYKIIMSYLQSYSMIPETSNFWLGIPFKVSPKNINLPPIKLNILTRTGKMYEWILTKKQYIMVDNNGMVEFKIRLSDDNNIRMGNIGMIGKKIGVDVNGVYMF